MRAPLRDRAQGRWPAILSSLGIADHYLTGKHTACPICRAGKDRFRFDDLEGRGTYICSQCGAGDGVKLVMEVNGWDFREAAKHIEAFIGDEPAGPPQAAAERGRKPGAFQRLWDIAGPSRLAILSRATFNVGMGLTTFPVALRTACHLRYPDASCHPAMLALITAPDGASQMCIGLI